MQYLKAKKIKNLRKGIDLEQEQCYDIDTETQGGGEMFDERKFRAALMLKGISLSEVAKAMGINVVTLYRKMSGESDFYRNEIQKFCELTGIENPSEIFFADQLA